MARRIAKKYKPFAQLSARRQRDEYIKLRGAIRREQHYYGGLFISDHFVEDDGSAGQWMDFCFLGLNGRTIWNATIQTANMSFYEDVENLAMERASKLSPEKESLIDWEWREIRKPDNIKAYAVSRQEEKRLPALGNLTYYGYVEKNMAEIAVAEPPSIFERFEIVPNYQYGIGLEMIVDAERLSISIMNETIKRFQNLGEKNWIASKPVAPDRMTLLRSV
ncbi:hypothetical protein [Brucella tritici]|uniref:hypothetical protein n=1 Tax=Brucella tritici TaxID=94626 RepID=UPI003D6CEECB